MAEGPNKIILPPQLAWETGVQILETDFDALGHVNNVMYLRYVQEVAGAHWASIASPEQRQASIWVVGGHEIDYRHSILPGQEVIGLTWVYEPQGMRFNRAVWLLSPDRQTVFAQALTTWLLLDATSGRPKRVERELLERFRQWMV